MLYDKGAGIKILDILFWTMKKLYNFLYENLICWNRKIFWQKCIKMFKINKNNCAEMGQNYENDDKIMVWNVKNTF